MADDPTSIAARWERWCIAAAVAGTAIVFWRSSNDPFAVPKLTVLALAAVGIVVLGLWHLLQRGELRVPRSPLAVAIVVFLALGGIAVLTSDVTWRSLSGPYGRGTGYVSYCCAGIVGLAVMRSVDRARLPWVVRAVLVGAGIVTAYALLQRIGGDPLTWTGFGDKAALSTLGNTNFVSGYLGATIPLAAWLGWTSVGRDRIIGAGLTAAMALAIVATASSQGVIAGGAGLGLFAIVVAAVQGGARRRQLVGGLLLVGVLGGVVALAGLAGKGPLDRLNDTGYSYRRSYWSAAIEMTADEPLAGVGFDRWAAHYRSVRSEEAASSAIEDTTDEPHSVPLAMFSGGGVPLGLAYLAVVAITAWLFLQGFRRGDDRDRLLIGGIGSAWLAYQVQSAVSIDVPAMPVLHLALAGLLAVAAGVEVRRVTVRPLVEERESGRGKKATVIRGVRTAGTAAYVVAGVVGLLAVWQLTQPLRGEMRLRDAKDAVSIGDQPGAIDAVREARKLNPDEGEYVAYLGSLFGRRQEAAVSSQIYAGAVKLDPRSFEYVLNAARTAAAVNSQDTESLYARARELEPNSPDLLSELGAYKIKLGNVAEGIELLEAYLAERPDDVDALVDLADAQDVIEDTDAADETFELAIEAADRAPLAQTYWDLGEALLESGRFEPARDTLIDALELSPGSYDIMSDLARAHAELGEDDDAIRLLEVIDGAHDVGYDEEMALLAELRGEAGTE